MRVHVSIETAGALAEAGLTHEWRVGDYVANREMLPRLYGGVVYQLAWGQFTPVEKRLLYVMRACGESSRWGSLKCLWLPRADQLLEELAQRKAPYTVRCISLPDNRWTWMLTVRDWITGNGPDLAEAAAAALLAVLQEEVQA